MSRYRLAPVALAKLVDSAWEDTRAWAIRFITDEVGADRIGPDAIIAICDSIRPDVQELGKGLLRAQFRDADGPRYLARLAEHPSPNLQLVVSALLERHVQDLASIVPFLATVLSQVNRGGAAKARAIELDSPRGRRERRARADPRTAARSPVRDGGDHPEASADRDDGRRARALSRGRAAPRDRPAQGGALMEFHHRYAGSSATRNDPDATAMAFAPDTLRQPTYFRGRLAKQLEFREAMSALHDVVTSDLRFIPKDRTGYFAWRDQQSYVDLAKVTSDQKKLAEEIATLSTELTKLEGEHSSRRGNFYAARQKYFDYLYKRDKELWFKLDPVITVHPDQVFFECFSRDESSYGRLAASYEVFEELGERAHGTTNIDYSEKLYGEFQKIRSYKTTTLDIDPTGFDVTTSLEERYREVKIDLPDTWVRGFLQVSSAATLPANVIELHPMDVHNLCLVLRRHGGVSRAVRSLRFQLNSPAARRPVAVDPWG